MEQAKKELQFLSDALLKTIREHGIKEISIEHYKTVLKKIVCFADAHGFSSYYPELKDDFDAFIDSNVKKKMVCFEYARFQHRVIRLLASLAETGETDFSATQRNHRMYNVSPDSQKVIEDALDYHMLEGETRTEMSTVMRHFYCYAEEKAHSANTIITDDLLMNFFTEELPNTNNGSMGRSLRAIKYLSVYLKSKGNADLKLDFMQLNARNAHVRVIPPYSQSDINHAVAGIDTSTPEGLRNYAIMLLAFDTGLRSVDIRKLRLGDIDWKKGLVLIRQSKTNEPLTLPLSGKVMNAIADYVLKARPECSHDEIFLTVKGPVKPLDKRHYALTNISDRYFTEAGVEKIPGRGFHSLRRSFATELSEAGVPLETISQLLGHKSIDEDKPYLSYNREQVAFCAIGFDEIPLTTGIYSGGDQDEIK